MKIKLDETHWLNSDSFCYWITALVEPKKDSKKKKPYEMRVSGYVATFEQAVDSLIDNKVRESRATNLKKLSEEIKELKAEVKGWKSSI